MTTPYTALAHDVPTISGTDLITCGSPQIVVSCPHCGSPHRHLGLGLRRSPCGRWYLVQAPASTLKRGRK